MYTEALCGANAIAFSQRIAALEMAAFLRNLNPTSLFLASEPCRGY